MVVVIVELRKLSKIPLLQFMDRFWWQKSIVIDFEYPNLFFFFMETDTVEKRAEVKYF